MKPKSQLLVTMTHPDGSQAKKPLSLYGSAYSVYDPNPKNQDAKNNNVKVEQKFKLVNLLDAPYKKTLEKIEKTKTKMATTIANVNPSVADNARTLAESQYAVNDQIKSFDCENLYAVKNLPDNIGKDITYVRYHISKLCETENKHEASDQTQIAMQHCEAYFLNLLFLLERDLRMQRSNEAIEQSSAYQMLRELIGLMNKFQIGADANNMQAAWDLFQENCSKVLASIEIMKALEAYDGALIKYLLLSASTHQIASDLHQAASKRVETVANQSEESRKTMFDKMQDMDRKIAREFSGKVNKDINLVRERISELYKSTKKKTENNKVTRCAFKKFASCIEKLAFLLNHDLLQNKEANAKHPSYLVLQELVKLMNTLKFGADTDPMQAVWDTFERNCSNASVAIKNIIAECRPVTSILIRHTALRKEIAESASRYVDTNSMLRSRLVSLLFQPSQEGVNPPHLENKQDVATLRK